MEVVWEAAGETRWKRGINLMSREVMGVIRLLSGLPRNPVFRMVMFARSGHSAQFGFLVLLILECLVVIGMGYMGSKGTHGVQYIGISVLVHTIATPLLLIAAVWIFHDQLPVAQKESLVLTLIPPRVAAFGALMPPFLACLAVIVIVPMVIVGAGLVIHFRELIEWSSSMLLEDGYPKATRGFMGGFGFWLNKLMMLSYILIYVIISLSLTRTLIASTLRSRGMSVFGVLYSLMHGVWSAAVLGAFLFFYMAAVLSSGRHELPFLTGMILLGSLGLFVLVGAVWGCLSSLGQCAARRWFAPVDVPDSYFPDWHDHERPLFGGPPSGGGFGLASLLPGRDMRSIFLRLACAAAVGVIAGVIVDGWSLHRNHHLHSPRFPDRDHLIIGSIMFATMVSAIMAFRWGGVRSWSSPPPIRNGRIRMMVLIRAGVLTVIAHPVLLAILADLLPMRLDHVADLTIAMLVILLTMPPVFIVHCVLCCLWGNRKTSLRTTVSVLAWATLIVVALSLPNTHPGQWLYLAAFLPPAAAIAFWLCGGGDALFQKLFEDRAAVPASDSDTTNKPQEGARA